MDIFDLALTMTPRVGNSTIQHLLKCFGSAEKVFEQSADQLSQRAELVPDLAASIVSKIGIERANAQIHHCQQHNIAMICANDEAYPAILHNLHDSPYVLYVQGNVELLERNLVSMVGTRKISSYGTRCCIELVEQIAKSIDKPVIVSGLAYGVDAACHRAALDNEIPTIAVLSTPLPTITPPQHRALASEILASGGALISEIRAGVSTGAKGFISRNRIVAGLSQATIIVESPAKGGAMTTAEIAISNNRMVGAVPGRIFDPASVGCNNLIAYKGAFPMTSVRALVRELNWEDRLKSDDSGAEAVSADQLDNLGEVEQQVLRCFVAGEEYHISQLERASGLDVAQLSATLMTLELMGWVRMLPGAKYELLGR